MLTRPGSEPLRRIGRSSLASLLQGIEQVRDAYGRSVVGESEESMVERTAVNPWQWSLQFGFNQAEIVDGGQRVLYCAGQTSVDGDGTPQFAGDMQAQISLAADNLEAVLTGAGMSLANVVRLNIYTTDVDAFIAHGGGTLGERSAAAGVAPPGTLLGVARLAFPELMVELEATAVE
jgi:enamine deaminase RidA (YjgF/YER057c/UK114 family)